MTAFLPGSPVGIPALIVTCEATWLAPIRMPGALACAGFDVTLVAPAGALAARSRHVAHSRALPEDANAQSWLMTLVAAIEATRPAIVLPGDETSVRLMQTYVASRPPILPPDMTRDDEVAGNLAGISAQIVGNTPEQFAADLRDDFRRWSAVISAAKLDTPRN